MAAPFVLEGEALVLELVENVEEGSKGKEVEEEVEEVVVGQVLTPDLQHVAAGAGPFIESWRYSHSQRVLEPSQGEKGHGHLLLRKHEASEDGLEEDYLLQPRQFSRESPNEEEHQAQQREHGRSVEEDLAVSEVALRGVLSEAAVLLEGGHRGGLRLVGHQIQHGVGEGVEVDAEGECAVAEVLLVVGGEGDCAGVFVDGDGVVGEGDGAVEEEDALEVRLVVGGERHTLEVGPERVGEFD
jgi:hypothetical protein